MGLTITSLPVYDNLTSIQDVYLNIRDIRTTKELSLDISNQEIAIYKLEFLYFIKKDNKHIKSGLITKTSETPYNNDLWNLSYAVMKEDLTNQNLSFTDNL